MPIVFLVKVLKASGSLRMSIPKEICVAMNLSPGDVLAVSMDDNEMVVKKKD